MCLFVYEGSICVHLYLAVLAYMSIQCFLACHLWLFVVKHVRHLLLLFLIDRLNSTCDYFAVAFALKNTLKIVVVHSSLGAGGTWLLGFGELQPPLCTDGG